MYTEYMSMLNMPTQSMVSKEYMKFPIVDNVPNLVCNTLASYGMKLPDCMLSPYLAKVNMGSYLINEVYVKYYRDTLTMFKYHLVDLLSWQDSTINNSQLLVSFRIDFPSKFDMISDYIIKVDTFLKTKKDIYKGDILKLTSLINSQEIEFELKEIAGAIDMAVPLPNNNAYFKILIEDYFNYIEDNKLLLKYRTKFIDVRLEDSEYKSIGYSPMISPLIGIHGISGLAHLNRGETLFTHTHELRPDIPPIRWIPEIINYLSEEPLDSTQLIMDKLNLKLTKSKLNAKVKRLVEVIVISECVSRAIEENLKYSTSEIYKYLVD